MVKYSRKKFKYSGLKEQDDSDTEKRGFPDDADDNSSYSSCASTPTTTSSHSTSFSHHSSQSILARKPLIKLRRPPRYKISHRITRYVCVALISSLLIFIVSLVRASVVSSRRIEAGNLGKRPPMPPETWRTFPFLTRYYGGIRTLVKFSENNPEYPPSDEPLSLDGTSSIPIRKIPESIPFQAYSNNSSIQKCYLDSNSKIPVPSLYHYEGRPQGFPDNILGSYQLLDLPEDICFERFGRLGPYGYGYASKYGGTGVGEHGDTEGSLSVWKRDAETNQIDYRNMNWAASQRSCHAANEARFKPDPHSQDSNKTDVFPKRLLRTAVVIRVWDDFEYREEDILNLRAMILELSLGSGGEYQVHLLVQVKDEAKNPVWADEETYQKHLNASVPEEFRGITTLWSETQMLMIYQGIFDTFARGPDLPIHGPYRGLQMAMQYFAHQHPEYDYFWHWEIDIRYTGHYYHFFSQVESWTTEQPRKGLWERNSRFYIPAVHGSWEDFKQMVRIQTEMGTDSPDKVWSQLKGTPAMPKSDKPIWGPERPQHEEDWFETYNDIMPPRTYEKDKYEWGVGEPADFVTFSPLFDPENTTWLLGKDITGYNSSDGLPPRRAAIVTSARMSKRLLQTMHRETAFKKHHAFSEMWAPTVALHHGYKAVYVPHPIYIDREWPIAYLSGTLNSGRNGATGGARTSVFGEREHNFLGMTWYYNAGFAPNLWKRWLGLKVNNDGGEEFEVTVDEGKNGNDVSGMKGGEGRMCLPPMLLHPVKSIELPVERVFTESQLIESDPAA
ncbi:hypothetical protein K3495_g10338 [Podosphaera aphanis]|nr:hypothetical protein K3495_g10338 [Podosphaera aphanis]